MKQPIGQLPGTTCYLEKTRGAIDSGGQTGTRFDYSVDAANTGINSTTIGGTSAT